ncbi:MAG: hypothetical protein ACM3NR_03555 [Methanosarcina sp.]
MVKKTKKLSGFLRVFFNKPRKNEVLEINDPLIIELSKTPKTRSQVAEEYGVTVKVLNRWFLEKNLIITQGLICPCDLKLIYYTIGLPSYKTGTIRF